MVVDIRVDGLPKWSASEIAVSEDSTPLDPSETFGGVGAIAFTIPETADVKYLMNKTVDLVDSERGDTQGVVRAMAGVYSADTGFKQNVKVEAHARLVGLVAKRTALPHVGTLESLFLYYFELCGVTAGVVLDASFADVPVVVPGWYGNVWEHVKKLCAAYRVEVSLVSGDIVGRDPRGFTASRLTESAFSWALDESQTAQTVEAWYYVPREITDELVVGNELSAVSNVWAGEVHEFDVKLSASLSSVVQPVCVDSVAYSSITASEYSVVDQYDEPVSAAEWSAAGGRVTVEISEDTRSLHITVIGSQDQVRAPYRLVGVAYTGVEFSTLRVVGTGVAFERDKYTLPANELSATEVGAEVDNVFLSSWGHAHTALVRTAGAFGGGLKRISGAAQFAAHQFGNVAGARLLEDYTYYRIRSASIGMSEVSYSAEVDTTQGDVDAVWDGYTVAEWDALWADRPVSEFDLRPLTPLSGVVTPPEALPYPDTFYPDELYPA